MIATTSARFTTIAVRQLRDNRHYALMAAPFLVLDDVSIGIGLRRFVGRLAIERGGVQLALRDGPKSTFPGPVAVTRTLLAPIGVSTDIKLGQVGAEDVVLRTGWRASSRIIAALREASIDVRVRQRVL